MHSNHIGYALSSAVGAVLFFSAVAMQLKNPVIGLDYTTLLLGAQYLAAFILFGASKHHFKEHQGSTSAHKTTRTKTAKKKRR